MRGGRNIDGKKGIAFATLLAIVALLIQALLPAAAMAARTGGDAVVLCTVDGMKTVTLDAKGQPTEQGFAGLPCADCLAATTAAILSPAITVEPASYVVRPAAQPFKAAETTPRARGPPRPFGQGPPVL